MNNVNEIVNPLVKWYQQNKRMLPWREEKDPYKIWISEIMLQQTRIEAVKEYYKKFMKELPTIHSLANIEEEKLLKLWEGLGYYNRARNLKKAAQMIEENYHGVMPKSYEELIKLPGIGEYTAGAIASISYNEKVPAVDGNVLRVISRVIGNRKNILEPEVKKEITQLLIPNIPKEAGDFNEGLMELGEMICLPNQEPLCDECPLKEKCYAYQNNLTKEIPVREKKLDKKIEEKTIFIFVNDSHQVAIQKRQEKGLLAGMYEFPNIEGKLEKSEIKKALKDWNIEAKRMIKIGEHQHIFTHKIWKMTAYQINIVNKNSQLVWASMEELQEKYAMPTAFNMFLKKIK